MTGLYFPYANRCFNITSAVIGHRSSGSSAQTGEDESASTSFSALKGGQTNLDYPTKWTESALRRSWGIRAVRCAGLSPFPASRSRQSHQHAQLAGPVLGEQTPQGPEVPSRVCLCGWQLDEAELELLGHLLQGPRKAFPVSEKLLSFWHRLLIFLVNGTGRILALLLMGQTSIKRS